MKLEEINNEIDLLLTDRKEINIKLNTLYIKKWDIEQMSTSKIWKDIIKITAKVLNIWDFEITSNSRIKEVVGARKILVYIFKKHLSYTGQNIANMLWLKSHCSSLYLYWQAEKLIKTNNMFNYNLKLIEKEVYKLLS